MKLLDKLDSLEKRATGAPWKIDGNDDGQVKRPYEHDVYFSTCGDTSYTEFSGKSTREVTVPGTKP